MQWLKDNGASHVAMGLGIQSEAAPRDSANLSGQPSPEKKQKTANTTNLRPSAASILNLLKDKSGTAKIDKEQDEDPAVQYIYTDGACSSNGTTAGRAGIGIFHATNDSRNVSARLPGMHQTNQRAELFAVLKALEQLYHQILDRTQSPTSRRVVIRTDSNYVIQAITDWSQRWERNGWRSKSGKPVVSKDLFQRARGMLSTLEEKGVVVGFEHVRGHSGVWGNEQADRLAVLGTLMEEDSEGDWWEGGFDDEELDKAIAEWEEEGG